MCVFFVVVYFSAWQAKLEFTCIIIWKGQLVFRKRKSYRFGTTWGWVNKDRLIYFFKCVMVYLHSQYMWGTMLSFKIILVKTLSLTHAKAWQHHRVSSTTKDQRKILLWWHLALYSMTRFWLLGTMERVIAGEEMRELSTDCYLNAHRQRQNDFVTRPFHYILFMFVWIRFLIRFFCV